MTPRWRDWSPPLGRAIRAAGIAAGAGLAGWVAGEAPHSPAVPTPATIAPARSAIELHRVAVHAPMRATHEPSRHKAALAPHP